MDYHFSRLQKGEISEPYKLAVRADTILYFFSKADRVTIVYQIDFNQKSDLVIGRVFMNVRRWLFFCFSLLIREIILFW